MPSDWEIDDDDRHLSPTPSKEERIWAETARPALGWGGGSQRTRTKGHLAAPPPAKPPTKVSRHSVSCRQPFGQGAWDIAFREVLVRWSRYCVEQHTFGCCGWYQLVTQITTAVQISLWKKWITACKTFESWLTNWWAHHQYGLSHQKYSDRNNTHHTTKT